MFFIYKSNEWHGDLMYNVNCIIGIYDNMTDAKNDLIKKLAKLKYTYELEFDDEEYLFIKCETKNGIELTSSPIPCFEIIKRKINLNEIKFRSR